MTCHTSHTLRKYMYFFHLIGFLLPKNLLSFITGWIVRLRFPEPFNRRILHTFVNFFGIDMSEASKNIDEFRCIEDVFTRALKPQARLIRAAACSPADGILSVSDAILGSDQAMQVKGITYSTKSLVFGHTDPDASFDPRWFFTVYLAPHNYHRVHSPFAGTISRLRYIPGKLWPVNEYFVQRMPNLFNINERLVFDLDVAGGGKAWIVMVGAFNVGRMETPLAPGFVTNQVNRFSYGSQQEMVPTAHTQIQAGDEIGTFLLGSTVVVVCDEILIKRYPLVQSVTKRPILMGESLLR